MIEALFDIADPTSCNVAALAASTPPLVPSPPPLRPLRLLLFAGDPEYSLVSESGYHEFACISIFRLNSTTHKINFKNNVKSMHKLGLRISNLNWDKTAIKNEFLLKNE